MTHDAGSIEIIRFLTPKPGSVRLARASVSIGLGLGWSMGLTIGGGLLASNANVAGSASGSAPSLASTMLLGGLTLAIAGLFVFMLSVGGPIFPRASRRLTRNTEAILGVAVLAGLACTVLTLIL